ncbi:AAA family ATPase [Niallia circulans]|uniref:AAA family ATPase n=1 Tax=Niallia circulans TaxID=1397 RepID=UPI00155F6571|nr:AAA family ATPase [Niallia circulans]NRG30674.1 AAA family ATPase [Niallia circulans]
MKSFYTFLTQGIFHKYPYFRERKQPITLTTEQKRLVELKSGSIRRWSGVAGSGKTLILATKATEAIMKGQRVLILTFNITLRHYIRDLCSQQHGQENRRLLKTNLTIAHFHGFLKILLAELKLSAQKDDVENYTINVMNAISDEMNVNFPGHLKYDSIFIDEGQDFNGDWIRFLKQLYTNNGELLVFYDQAQDLYKQSLWITDPIHIEGIGFKGQLGNLKISHRLPQSIVSQIGILRNLLDMENQEKILTMNSQQDLFTRINWQNISADENRAQVVEKNIRTILSEGISTIEDITVITMKEDTGIELVNYFESLNVKTSHVYDLSGQKDYNERRNEKWRFQPGKGRLKVCSYHSYKGWESSHIILLLEGIGDDLKRKEELQNALFIAITRVNAFSDSRSFLCINNCPDFNWLVPHFNGE